MTDRGEKMEIDKLKAQLAQLKAEAAQDEALSDTPEVEAESAPEDTEEHQEAGEKFVMPDWMKDHFRRAGFSGI
jgi:hypothetical protein